MAYMILDSLEMNFELLKENSISLFTVAISFFLLTLGIFLNNKIFYHYRSIKEKLPYSLIFKDVPPFENIKDLEFHYLFRMYSLIFSMVHSAFIFGMIAALQIKNYSPLLITSIAGFIGYIFIYPNFDNKQEEQEDF